MRSDGGCIHAASFSRGGFTNPFGKLGEAPVRGLRLPRRVEEELHKQAASISVPFHEYVREVLTIQALGVEEVKRTYAARFDAIEKCVEETAPKE